ncbi:MAG: methionyl-tRNA formyltransferase [Candidatus Doudnabacteria bacterium RIFCSPHIGHO2_01_FULL_45_18]|uniref:Methionyl-tRNA formyltransferase n=1 Tax=Candidatus Doudnabacteria bacterium RIFCSPHIGHO2_01_FULL_45_18 TaxID=1817823 RepID=A0A1F5NR90_9BACT|nr:MAG: methionyl-tRNA formyltransferase [Candidatus Doudnabacteria bacterium RIFCSPHIGHO2_01_FULL_45_18]
MKIIFVGTTVFGIPTLEKLKADHQLVLVITQPDMPTGRKRVLTPPPIKVWSHKNNIPLSQPVKILDCQEEITKNNPDLILVAAYGQIIPKAILDIPKFGSINIHGSLLPKYRGASPIQAAILNGDGETGITLILMDEQMDHGPIIAKEVIRLSGDETYPVLYAKLSQLSATFVPKLLSDWFDGKMKPAEQIHAQATFTKLLSRSDAKLDWTQPAKKIDQKIRALNPEPGTWTTLDGKTVKILSCKLLTESKIELPGKIYPHLGQLAVKCLDGSIIVTQIQPEGGSIMTGGDLLNGLKSGSRLFI